MRIAWVVYDGLAARTGGTLYDAYIVDGLRAAGDVVEVVVLEGRGRVLGGLGLARRLRAVAPDVVVGDELCFAELGPAFLLDRNERVHILLVHHLSAWEAERPLPQRLRAAFLELCATRAATDLVATSTTTAERVRRDTGRLPFVVRPGCDRLARVSRVAASTPTLLFVGTIARRKRVLELCRAFARSAHRDARLLLAGSTTREPAYVTEVTRAIAGDPRIDLLGEQDDDALTKLYASADAVVMPSSLEGFGIAAVEAIHAGTPVIAARTSGLVEALAPCPDATIFVDDDDALAVALGDVTRSAERRRALADAASAAARHLGTWANAVASFRDIVVRASG